MTNSFPISFCFWLLACCLPTASLAQIYLVNTPEELRQALVDAQQNNESNTIYLAPGTYTTGEAGPFRYQSPHGHNLSLIGDSADSGSFILDGGGAEQVLVLGNGQPGGTFTLQGLTLVSNGQGLQIQNGNARIEACAFVASSSPPPSSGAPNLAMAEPNRFWWGNNGNNGNSNDPDRETEAELEKSIQKAKGRWVLLGTARTIKNMKLFDHYNAVWAYQDGAWKAYSSKQDIQLRLYEQKVEELKQIPAYSGFWVWRD